MMLLSFMAGVCCGLIPGIAYARREIAKIKRDDLSFRMAPVISNSVEDAIRRAGA
jgi:hypothetical protein